MTATVFDLTGIHALRKGLPWALRFTRYAGKGKSPVNLTGCAARFEVFDSLAGRAAPALVTLTSADGDIVLGGTAGTVVIKLGTASADWSAKNLRYRLWFTDSLGDETLYFYGRLALLDGEW